MFHKQIARGVALLDDRRGPDWVRKIDIDRLALSSPARCVLGQQGGYGWMRKKLKIKKPYRYGFDLPNGVFYLGYLALVVAPIFYLILTLEWKQEIRLLQMEHGRMRPDLAERRDLGEQRRQEWWLPFDLDQSEYALAGR